MSEPRSWLFVPADNERKVTRALESDADAIIFDLEDSVAPARKESAREILKRLPKRSNGPEWWIRVNPLGSEFHKEDLKLIGSAYVHGIVLPKSESGADVIQLAHRTGNIRFTRSSPRRPQACLDCSPIAIPNRRSER